MENKEILEPWGETVYTEHETLKSKFSQLVDFINSEKFYTLSLNSQKLLNTQKMLMEHYIKILNTRLYEDVDSIFVPDTSYISLLFGSLMFSPFNTNSSSTSALQDALKDTKENHDL